MYRGVLVVLLARPWNESRRRVCGVTGLGRIIHFHLLCSRHALRGVQLLMCPTGDDALRRLPFPFQSIGTNMKAHTNLLLACAFDGNLNTGYETAQDACITDVARASEA